MIDTLQTGRAAEGLAHELAALIDRVRANVVQVRGSRFGAGSGVVWTDDGIVVTNHHVVPTGSRVEIETMDGRTFAADVLGSAPGVDLAALRLHAGPTDRPVQPATVARDARPRVGDLALAVGNPLGERGAATLGIVSGRDRVPLPGGRRDVLRISITVRPGNSGGALVDARGRIVGIPFMVSGARQALAVPADVVEGFLTELGVRSGKATAAGGLGIRGQMVRLPDATYALLVAAVEVGSPAERAGLIIGDLVPAGPAPTADAAFDSARAALRSAIRPGGRPLTIRRGGVPRTIVVDRQAA